jgi:hypothetical protein
MSNLKSNISEYLLDAFEPDILAQLGTVNLSEAKLQGGKAPAGCVGGGPLMPALVPNQARVRSAYCFQKW